jgi:hypothetical protein
MEQEETRMDAVFNILTIVVIMAILILAARFLMRFGVKEDVTVSSPQGEMATVSKAEARHRVTQGWTYRPVPLPPVAPPR